MSFWESRTGKPITGLPQDSFVKNFVVIPDSTVCEALIKSFKYACKTEENTGNKYEWFEIVYKICDGDFVNAEVTQKIKCFSGKDEQIDRALNMLRLIMELCEFKPAHKNQPSDEELGAMQGKMVSIKIREWAVEKQDGSGIMEGNFVSEVHKAGSIKTETGIKQVSNHVPSIKNTAVGDSALTRNSRAQELDLDIDVPF